MAFGDLTDDKTFAIDYLGRKQPLISPRLTLQGGGGAVSKGGGVASPIAPTFGPGSFSMSSGSRGGDASLGLAMRGLDLARQLMPSSDKPGTVGTRAETEAELEGQSGGSGGLGATSASEVIRSQSSPGQFYLGTPERGYNVVRLPVPASGGASAGEGATGLGEIAGPGIESGVASGSAGFAGSGAGGAVTAGAGEAVGSGVGIGTAAGSAAAELAGSAGMGPVGLAYTVARLASMASEAMSPSSDSYGQHYNSLREFAGESAARGLLGIEQPGPTLETLQAGGAGGHVRGALNLSPEAAAAVGMKPGSTEFSAFTPQAWNHFLEFVQKNPDALDSMVTGSGDVPYLEQNQAEDVAAQARTDTINAIRGMTPNTNQPAKVDATGADTAAAAASELKTPAGPSGALGFANDLLSGSE